MALTKNELKLISELLKLASDEFSNHGCNDLEIPNTEENKQLLIDMINWNGDEYEIEEEIPEIQKCKKKMLFTHDSFLMSYLAARCEEEAE